MRLLKIGLLLAIIILFNSCASKYTLINPNSLNYNSTDIKNGISLEYKYDLLPKKYAKKEIKRGVKVVAIKVKNTSEKDIVFGEDFKLAYENGKEIYIMEHGNVFQSLKQLPATHLLYLLLAGVQFNKTTTTGGRIETTSIPIGLVIGPGLAIGNMLVASSANKKFKTELLENNLNGVTIKKGETKSGLIGVRSNSYDAIRIKVE